MATVSVIILARNEEHNIHDCIESVQFADEVLVIDDFSTDNTVTIAEEMGARVVQHAMNGDWGAQQTFGIEQAKSDWILFLDADERISEPLAKEIQDIVVNKPMPKEGSYVEGYVHPAIITPYPTEKLQHPMYHYTYDNWHQYFNKFNNYTTLSAEKYRDNGKSCSFFKDIILRPTWAFIKVYLLQGGILDGKMGFILSVNHYFYTMTKYVKFYYLLKSKGKL